MAVVRFKRSCVIERTPQCWGHQVLMQTICPKWFFRQSRVSGWRVWAWVIRVFFFFNTYGRGCLHTGPPKEGYIGCHTLVIYRWFFCFGGHSWVLLHPLKPHKFHFWYLYSVAMPVSSGHTASAQRTACGLSSYKDVAGELRGKPRIQKLRLLKVNLFFSFLFFYLFFIFFYFQGSNTVLLQPMRACVL